MTSIITTIEADIGKAVAWAEQEASAVGTEALTVLKAVGATGLQQAVALAKETDIGAFAADVIGAIKTAGSDPFAAIPSIIADVEAEIKKLGSVAGFENEVTSLATSIVHTMLTDLEGTAGIGALVTLVAGAL